MSIRPLALLGLLALVACGEDPSIPGAGGAPAAGAPVPAELAQRSGAALEKGRAWLLSKRDPVTGAWGKKGKVDTTVGYTALAASAVIAATPREAVGSDASIAAALDYVAAAQKPDGSVFANGMVVNYETSAAVGAVGSPGTELEFAL